MKFKVVSSDAGVEAGSGPANERIQQMLSQSPVFLFMKGTPEAPQCGFSYRVVEVLNAWKVPFSSFNVLSDESIRNGVKEFANWPTIPQLYVNQEFVGGCDIVEEMSGNGELGELFQEAYPDQSFEAPPPPAQVQNIHPEDAAKMLENDPELFLLDVRPENERQLAAVGRSRMIDQALAEEIINTWDPERPLVFICHIGQRSLQAAEFFTQKGFRQVYNVTGGVDAWSLTVDSSLPRY